MLRNVTLVVVSLAIWAPPALSQEADVMVPDEGVIHVMLLRQKSVRDALKLTDDEAKQIKEHNHRQWAKAQEIHKLPQAERHQKYEALSRENEEFIAKTLDPAERKRLDEISLQVAGLLMATSPTVATQLGLTEQQREQLRQHQHKARAELARALHTKSKEGREEKIRELHATNRKALMDVLTDEQEVKWKLMTGAPFDQKFVHDPD